MDARARRVVLQVPTPSQLPRWLRAEPVSGWEIDPLRTATQGHGVRPSLLDKPTSQCRGWPQAYHHHHHHAAVVVEGRTRGRGGPAPRQHRPLRRGAGPAAVQQPPAPATPALCHPCRRPSPRPRRSFPSRHGGDAAAPSASASGLFLWAGSPLTARPGGVTAVDGVVAGAGPEARGVHGGRGHCAARPDTRPGSGGSSCGGGHDRLLQPRCQYVARLVRDPWPCAQKPR